MKSREQDPIDFVKGSFVIRDEIRQRNLTLEDSTRAQKVMYIFKNSVIYYLLRNRKDRKNKNLRKILEEFVQRKNRQKEMQRQQKRLIENLPLDEKLEKMIGDDKILTDIQFENVQEVMGEIVKEKIEQNFMQLRLLKSNFESKLLKRDNGKSMMSDYKNM